MAGLILALLLPGSLVTSGTNGEDDTALGVAVTFWPEILCAGPGTVVPVGLRVDGRANTDYEVSAWLYNARQLANVWSTADSAWKWAHYLSVTTNETGVWEGYRYLQLKREADLDDPYYLKAKVRNGSTSVEVKLVDWALLEPGTCAGLTGHVGNGSDPFDGYLVELHNATGVLTTANLSGVNPWSSHNMQGWFSLTAPPDNYTLRVIDAAQTVVLSHEISLNMTGLDLSLGWQWHDDPDPPDPQDPEPAGPAGKLMTIVEVAPDTYLSGDPDEYIALYNPSDRMVDLSGWALADNAARAIFPYATAIAPGQTLRIALNGSAYFKAWGTPPDLEQITGPYRDSVGLPLPTMGGERIRLANSGDVVELRDATGQAIDTVVYGEVSYYDTGWEWPFLEAPSKGQVLVRWSGEDTNSSADWEGRWQSLKIGFSRWPATTHPFDGGTSFVSPDSSFATLIHLIDNTDISLDVNLYLLTSPWLSLRLANASARGVKVRLLLEGSPVGGLTNESLWAAHTVAQAGGRVRLLAADNPNGTTPRFRNDHAKYLIADDRQVAVMSENWNRRGIPYEPGYGNRGWGVILDSPGLAGALGAIFDDDFDPSRGDSRPWGWDDLTLPEGAGPNWTLDRQSYTPAFPALDLGTGNATLVISPDTVMGDPGLPGLLATATSSIRVQQASLPLFWEGAPNPYLEAVVEAARRGVEVKVILDGGLVYNIEENSMTIDHLNAMAEREGLDMEARLFPGHPMVKVHNKGAIVDSRYILVGSTNWVRAAAMDNREISLWLDCPGAAIYFSSVFEYDWALAGGSPKGNREEKGIPGFHFGSLTMVIIIVAIFKTHREKITK